METNTLIFYENQWTVSKMTGTSVMREVNEF